MTSHDGDPEDAQITPDLLDELASHAHVLGVFDEGQDIALDLHEGLFSPSTRRRALDFLTSDRYRVAATTIQGLQDDGPGRHDGEAGR